MFTRASERWHANLAGHDRFNPALHRPVRRPHRTALERADPMQSKSTHLFGQGLTWAVPLASHGPSDH